MEADREELLQNVSRRLAARRQAEQAAAAATPSREDRDRQREAERREQAEQLQRQHELAREAAALLLEIEADPDGTTTIDGQARSLWVFRKIPYKGRTNAFDRTTDSPSPTTGITTSDGVLSYVLADNGHVYRTRVGLHEDMEAHYLERAADHYMGHVNIHTMSDLIAEHMPEDE